MSNFEDILNRPAAEIERPKPYPVGTYLCLVEGPIIAGTIGKDPKPIRTVKLKFLQTQEDVDQSAIEAAGGVIGKSIQHRFFITEQAVWRYKEFLVENLGIDESGKTLNEMASEAPGRQVYAKVRHRPSEDGTQIFSEIESFSRV